jgi:hypothetical protein
MASFLVKFIIRGKNMMKIKNTKAWLIIIFLSFGFTNANAVSLGDKIYVVLGNGSSGYVKQAYVLKVGSERSKVDWTNCSDCNRWVKNERFYYSYDSAQEIVDKMDSEDISFGEVAGTIAVIGIIGAFIHAASKK